MCGITGYINLSNKTNFDNMRNTIRCMAQTLSHRGPDDQGDWIDEETGIALGHRRLSILDLSPEGHQPMLSNSGRYVIVFNGEIYNFKSIHQELENSIQGKSLIFRGHSDTEVMLAAIEAWGLEKAVKRFVGMFAFALWDRMEKTLYLVRDRMGEKPLYYGFMGGTFMFASELKSLRSHPDFKAEINRDALALYLRHNYIPAPHSIYKETYKLLPGTILKVNGIDGTKSLLPYWSLREEAEHGTANHFEGNENEAINYLDELLRQSVRQQMIADVPLGAFLSGGIDSSTIVALMQAQSKNKVKTFTIGFNEEGFNEAVHAKAIAQHLGTDHHELYVTPQQAMDVIPQLPHLYDEPFSDSSQIPTFLVSQLAKQQVTVSLSGDGGDELFGGYDRYFVAERIWGKFKYLPGKVRITGANLIKAIPVELLNNGLGWLSPFLPQFGRGGPIGDKLYKIAEIASVEGSQELYRLLVSLWKDPENVVYGSREPFSVLADSAQVNKLPNYIEKLMYLDTITYLPDDILVKVDRASMGVSLESRVPLLDHRVVEFAWRLPMSMKIKDGQGKWILRQVLDKYVPKKLIDRPKMGFGVPIDSWLRGPLREWAEELLDEKRLREEGFFNPGLIREKWKEHLEGKHNWQYYLWDILMFQSWLEKQ